MRHPEPPAQLCWSQPCIFVVPTPIIKPEVEIFRDANSNSSYPLEGSPSFKVPCITRCPHTDFRHQLQAVVRKSHRYPLALHRAEPIFAQLAAYAYELGLVVPTGSVLCISIWCFLSCSMNVVLRLVCSLLPSHIFLSGTPKSVMNCFKASPACPFDSNGYTAAEKWNSVANTWAYLFPSSDLYCQPIVSVYTVPRIRGLSYMRSPLYLRARGNKAEHRIRWVVFLMVSLAFLRPINRHSLKSCGETEECLLLLWNVGA